MSDKIRQLEGMCLMLYQCEKCSMLEVIWNSRPRITPFCIDCAKCDGIMQHIEWNEDRYAPNHIPQKGDRIFVDWSREAAEKYYDKFVDKYWDDNDYNLSDRYKTKEDAKKAYAEEWKFGEAVIETI